MDLWRFQTFRRALFFFPSLVHGIFTFMGISILGYEILDYYVQLSLHVIDSDLYNLMVKHIIYKYTFTITTVP